jgi:hypothetical protein
MKLSEADHTATLTLSPPTTTPYQLFASSLHRLEIVSSTPPGGSSLAEFKSSRVLEILEYPFFRGIANRIAAARSIYRFVLNNRLK